METYSYSKITRFESCPLSYMRKYLDNEELSSHGITECGLFMHDLMEKYGRKEIAKEDLVEYFEENFYDNIKSTTRLQISESFSKDMYSLYYDGFLEFLENFEDIKNLKKIVDVEKSFTLPYKDYQITGKIDLVYRDVDDNLIFLDYKSKKKFKDKKEKVKYSMQLYIYSYFAKELYGEYPTQIVFSMMRGEPVFIKFSEEDMMSAMEWFDSNVKKIRNSIYYPATPDTFYCRNWCGLDKCDECIEEM